MHFPGLLAELKRRNVYRVAVAYLVVGWLLVQVATQVFPFFEIPSWVVRLVILSLLFGLPVALAFAWIFRAHAGRVKTDGRSGASRIDHAQHRTNA